MVMTMRTLIALALVAAGAHAFGVRRSTVRMAAGRPPQRHPMDSQVKDILTVRAIDSFNFYALEFKDETTVEWLEGYKNRTDVSVVGSTNFLLKLMRTEPENIRIKKMRQMPRGGSGNNPYLKNNGVALEYDILIDPLSIARRVLSVRAQLAEEWAHDLQSIYFDNEEILRHYDDSSQNGVVDAESRRQMVYDTDDPMISSSTPFRAKNYKDLKRVITAEACALAEESLRDQRQMKVAEWFKRFLVSNQDVEGSELVEKLIGAEFVVLPSSKSLRVIEPRKIAKMVMKYRHEIAEKWITECGQVSNDHTRLNAMALEHQFHSDTQDIEAALAEQLREERSKRRSQERENMVSGPAQWWEGEDAEMDLDMDVDTKEDSA